MIVYMSIMRRRYSCWNLVHHNSRTLLFLLLCFCCQHDGQGSSSSLLLLFGVREAAAASYVAAPATAAGWFKKKKDPASTAAPTAAASATASPKQSRILATVTGIRAGGYTAGGDDSYFYDASLLGDDDDDDKHQQQKPGEQEEEDDYSLPPSRPFIQYPASAHSPPAAAFGHRQEGHNDESQPPQRQQQQQVSPPPPRSSVRRALILMDAFCDYHGLYLANRILRDETNDDNETAVIFVLSDYLRGYLLKTQPENAATWQAMRMPRRSSSSSISSSSSSSNEDIQLAEDKDDARMLQQWTLGLEIVGIYCESDSGLQNAEELRELLLLNVTTLCDDPHVLPARRDKFLMNEHIGNRTNLPVARQQLCSDIQQARDFCMQLGMSSVTSTTSSTSTTSDSSSCRRVVVKPCRGVASEDVKLCHSIQQVEAAFAAVLGTPIFGASGRHEAVLVQEYLIGREYAVDVVCRQGDYKVAAVWRYDKRPNINTDGEILADFCYYQTQLVDATMDANVAAVCDYVKQALQALGIRQGLSHTEVIVTNDGRGPVLVEINCRQHNMDFVPLTMICIGYNALDMTLAALLGSREEWDSFPDMAELHNGRHGCMVHLVNSKAAGTLKHVPQHMDEISQLPSFLNGHVYPHFLEVGGKITPTIDIKSDAGWIQLVHEDEAQLEKDYQQILDWMPTMFDVDVAVDDNESP